MDDQTILKHIQDLVDEEHPLMEQHTQGELASHEHERMQALEVSLDQCWDLLHQRRARRHAGLNPEDAQERDPKTVEHYLQ